LATVAGIAGANWISAHIGDEWMTSDCQNWDKQYNDMPDECRNAIYLDYPEGGNGWGYYFIQKFGTWILIFTNFVPISLMVTFEVVKFW
jgi:hypothetical protein